jgi:hypothetical protein
MSAITGPSGVYPGQLLQFDASRVPAGFTVAPGQVPFILNEPQPWIVVDNSLFTGAVSYSSCAAFGDSVYVCESYSSDNSVYLSRYDRLTETKTALGVLPQAGYPGGENPVITVIPDGRVLIVGGSTPSGATSAATYTYTPTSATTGYFTQLWTAPFGTSMCGLVQLTPTTFMLVGGYQNGTGSLASCAILNINEGWTVAASLAQPLQNAAVCVLGNGKVFCGGGFQQPANTAPTTYQIYDPVSNTWSPLKAVGNVINYGIAGPTQNGCWMITGTRTIAVYDMTLDAVTPSAHQLPFIPAANWHTLGCNTQLQDGSYYLPRSSAFPQSVRYAPSPNALSVYVYATKNS